MAKENFQFLFKRYKINQLSGKDLRDWLIMVSTDDFKPFIESDIEEHMLKFLFDELGTLRSILQDIHRERKTKRRRKISTKA